jgi:AcrR family transcriptional regulator
MLNRLVLRCTHYVPSVPRRPAGPMSGAPPAGPRGQLRSGRHGLSGEIVAESQRSRILNAMRDALADGGYAEASLLHITKRAGVSRKTFYEHFADKEECFVAVYRDARTRLSGSSTRALARPGRWPARTVAGIAALMEALAADPAAARIVLIEVLSAGERARRLRNESVVALARSFRPTAADRAELGLPAEVAGGATEVVVGGISEMVYREIVEGRTDRLPFLLPDIAFAAISPLLGSDAARSEIEKLTGCTLGRDAARSDSDRA